MIHEYNLGTPWNVSTSTYSYDFLSTYWLESQPTALFFKTNGSSLYVLGTENKRIYQYNLTNNWNLSSASYSSISFSISAQENNPTGLYIRDNGFSFYIIGSNKRVYQYNTTNSWQISSSSYTTKSFSVSSQELNPQGIYFKNDGKKFYIIGYNETVYEYVLNVPWDVTTSFYSNKRFSLRNLNIDSNDIFFKNDGKSFYVVEDKNDNVFQFDGSESWELSSFSNIAFSDTIRGGNFRKSYNDLKNITQILDGNYIFCDTEVIFDLSDFDKTQANIIKVIFDADNGDKIQTFNAYVSSNAVVYPDLSEIKAIYYPSTSYYTYYNPKFTLIYDDGMTLNLTMPITSVQCGIFESYKNKTMVESIPLYRNPKNVLLFINDKEDDTVFIGNVNTRLSFVLENEIVTSTQLPFVIQPAPIQSTIQVPQPPSEENPVLPPAPVFTYSQNNGIQIVPNNSIFLRSDEFITDNTLIILSGGAPYFAGDGIIIRSIRG